MKCGNCGASVASGKKFCPKCGMPIVDYKARPEEDEDQDIKTIGKRITELKPKVDAIKEKEEKEKEEKRRKAEEERKRKEEEARKAAEMEEEEDEWEGWPDEDEDEDEDEESGSYSYGHKSEEDEDDPGYAAPHIPHKKAKIKKDSLEVLEPMDLDEDLTYGESSHEESADAFDSDAAKDSEIDTLTIMELNDNSHYYEDKEVRIYGNVLVVLHAGDENVFMIEDEYDSIECHVELPDAGYVERDGMSFSSDEIVSVVSDLKKGEKVMIRGKVGFKGEDEPILLVSYIEGENIMIWCSDK